MNELIVVALVIGTLAIAYLWVYPRVAGNDVKKMAWLDIALGLVLFAFVGAMFWSENPPFSLVFFETNWFIFTLAVYVILELPLFFLYVKARGLGEQYKAFWRGSMSTSTSVKSVQDSLEDTRWDGLRTPAAKRALLVSTNLVALVGGALLWFMPEDSGAGFAVSLVALALYLLLLGAGWYLLRQSTRLIADAPDDALDERTVSERNRSYLPAYRVLTTAVMIGWIFVLGFTAAGEELGVVDDPYVIELTMKELQVLFWGTLFYVAALPSMALAWASTEKKRIGEHTS